MGNATAPIHLLAGERPDGEKIFEEIEALELDSGHYLLSASPAFCKGIAAGDIILLQDDGSFTVAKHGGNLCVRVYAREGMQDIAENLAEGIAELQGRLDIITERVIVFSISVSRGFAAIEAIFNRAIELHTQAMWVYGNVYAQDGVTPLNWWRQNQDDGFVAPTGDDAIATD